MCNLNVQTLTKLPSSCKPIPSPLASLADVLCLLDRRIPSGGAKQARAEPSCCIRQSRIHQSTLCPFPQFLEVSLSFRLETTEPYAMRNGHNQHFKSATRKGTQGVAASFTTLPSCSTYSGSISMHQKSSTQHKHSYMQTVTSNEEEGILSLVQTHGMQTNSRPILRRKWVPLPAAGLAPRLRTTRRVLRRRKVTPRGRTASDANGAAVDYS